ncbi:MAG: hypothetical protein QOE45_352 [Frankiaceae bacterium]|nr:hypothetical protein [Frankiaceae bacterium]
MPGGVGNAGAVVRVGDTVRRPAGPHTPATQAFLAHLAARGFDGAPCHLGYDEGGREVLTFVPGDVAAHEEPPAWCLTEDALVSVVTLVRRLHEAAAGFVAPPGARWAWPPPAAYRTALVGHNDVCRENVVFAGGRAAALIDFDFAGPSSAAWEMAGVLRHWVLALPGDRVARARLACATYGVAAPPVVTALLHRLDWGLAMVRTRAAAGEPGFAAMWQAGLYDRNRAMRAWVEAELAPDRLDG